MDRVTQYRKIVQDFLRDFAADDPEAQLVFDTERDHYLVMHIGWRSDYRIYGCAMQLDLVEGKVWIQHNSTEIFVDRELIQRGVAPQDIVLGFRSPKVRERLAAALQSNVGIDS
ncbi:XisI protein [Gloeocapsopsis dulcis]|uniref:XisI protein n=1 Tax=Gloeocapsopsis dulcis AAB1 = 1H9 TaxID=1433147 RepID=A0A6N8FPI2_9CHRO|nr:XisI protein [Gloeocapsopsis dulcis]MUL35173.1 XisI protein [Gloeocapsopsis dulcis AAB1 = 1H9]WNN89055.1 XisI protein [Gloeocapsopsis dulcis]